MSWVRFLAQTPTCRQVIDALQQSRQSDTLRSSLNLWIWLGVSAAVTLVQLGQFIPQHVELYRRKSVVGLSAWTLFFGSLYTYMTMIDYLVQSRGQWLHSCTQGWSVCFLELQPFVQVVGSWLLVGLLWFWYLRYEKLDEARELQRSRAGIIFVESSSKPLWTSSRRKRSPETTSTRNASAALSPRPDSRGANDLEADSPDPHWWHAVPSEHYRHAHYRHHRYYFDDSAYATAFFRIFCAVAVLVGASGGFVIGARRNSSNVAPELLRRRMRILGDSSMYSYVDTPDHNHVYVRASGEPLQDVGFIHLHIRRCVQRLLGCVACPVQRLGQQCSRWFLCPLSIRLDSYRGTSRTRECDRVHFANDRCDGS
ncbi:hypothetical protein F1559_000708 [Cyanidiococcus yangmingshanensis]|uniref:Uncharacterized protein n=1 Tax=Cyanidiococcus yangmingshanensis TaxID=2690220 RepID=A0A7J7IJZ8_9RHOD|nr:hypothetical protein F1559_000708 [Cyanidiococcus yangmingshanensis]